MVRRWLLLAGLSALLVPTTARAQDLWQPARTWVFAVGVLQFDDPSYASWPDEGRVDAEMIAALKRRGVPEDQVVFIKNREATRAAVTEQFDRFLQRPAAGDTLLFYYAGHGGRDYTDERRPVSFATYDTRSEWSVREIVNAIERRFKGSRALLLADCCHSGALEAAAAQRNGRIGYGVLTSAQASARSTGNWTFTQCVVDVLNGSPLVDADGDRKITFQEAARYTDSEMTFCEDQRASFGTYGSFSRTLVLSEAVGRRLPRQGEHVEARLGMQPWRKAKVLDAEDGRIRVAWVGRETRRDLRLEPGRVRAYMPDTLPVGTAVSIEWNGKQYPGKVVRVHEGLHLVHYNGYPESDDEWVARERLRQR